MGGILNYTQFLETYKTRSYRIKHLENYKHLFPIEASPKLAGIIADLIGDGHLQKEPWRADFTSKDVSELKRFEREIKDLFNLNCKIRKCTSNKYGKTYNIGINCSPVARILLLCGVPIGQKVLVSFKIPEWIREDKECFRRFCQRLFSCEGTIMHESRRKTPQIRIEMWKEEKLIRDGEKFMRDISNLMKEYFNIESKVIIQNKKNVRKDGIITRPIRLYIFGDSVIRFFNEIGFEGQKQKNLKALISK